MTHRTPTLSTVLAVVLLVTARPSPAQEWPAGTAVPAAAIGKGRLEVSAGFDLGVKNGVGPDEPARLWRVLPAGIRIGVARNVEIAGTWRGGLLARSGDGEQHSDWGDPGLFTKITFTDSGSTSSAGVMFGFKIPSTRHLPHKLGSDAADLYFRFLASRESGPAELRVNCGVAIVGDPRFAGSQDDLLTGSAMFILRPGDGWTWFGELCGFTGPKDDDDKVQFRGGAGFDAGFGKVGLYGNARVGGGPVDFGTAFDASGSWGVGISFSRVIDL